MALGFPHPRYLLDCLTSQDITDWIAYARAEPFGAVREDVRVGTVAALLYNTNRGKNAAALRWNDFFTNAEAPRAVAVEANPEKQSAKVIELFQEFNQRFKGA